MISFHKEIRYFFNRSFYFNRQLWKKSGNGKSICEWCDIVDWASCASSEVPISRFYAIKWPSGFRDGNRNYSNSRFASLKRAINSPGRLSCEKASSLSWFSCHWNRSAEKKGANSWKERIHDWLTISIKLPRLSRPSGENVSRDNVSLYFVPRVPAYIPRLCNCRYKKNDRYFYARFLQRHPLLLKPSMAVSCSWTSNRCGVIEGISLKLIKKKHIYMLAFFQ